jgi:hypothetical protein
VKKSRGAQLDRDIAESLHGSHGPSCGCPHAHSTVAAYRVAYGTSGGGRTFRDYDPNTFTSLKDAIKRRRVYKRNGYWAWIEHPDGTFVPVEGAKLANVQKHYPIR